MSTAARKYPGLDDMASLRAENLRLLARIVFLESYVAALKAGIETLRTKDDPVPRAAGILDLTKKEAAVLRVLMARDWASREVIHAEIYADRANAPALAVIKVYISSLRGKLRARGVEIESRGRSGWFLTEKMKAIIFDLHETAA